MQPTTAQAPTPTPTVLEILNSGDLEQIRALFEVDPTKHSTEYIRLKFRIWARHYFPKFFLEKGSNQPVLDAPDHDAIDNYNIEVYTGRRDSYLNIGYRGLAKTTRTKLLWAFLIANDVTHFRKYMKILSEDGNNSKQSVTDIYNLLIDPRLMKLHPEIWKKTDQKREETMSSFTTATGIKLTSGTIGQSQRGDLQEDARPDLVWFDDFETRIILRSAVKLTVVWMNMEEAKDGLAKGGGRIYTANYLSERGNVHKLVEKADGDRNVMTNVPLEDENGNPTWSRFSREDVKKIRESAEDYAGEYLGKPSKSKDVMVDRAIIDAMPTLEPIKDIAGFRIYKKYDPAHRYAGGADVAGGVGLDSSAAVWIDFSTFPAQVVACFDDNQILPESFGEELANEGRHFGEPLIAPENNKYDSAIGRLKLIYPTDKIYRREPKESAVATLMDKDPRSGEYGWNTNSLTKGTMVLSFVKAINDGLIALNDKKLKAEARSYTRNDLMDSDTDPRLTTRHYDLFIAACIAWQMKDLAEAKPEETYEEEEEDPLYKDIGL